jgi:predicted HTH transcriptional regulator
MAPVWRKSSRGGSNAGQILTFGRAQPGDSSSGSGTTRSDPPPPHDERVLAERRRALDGPYDGRSIPGSTLGDLDLALFRSTYLPSMVSPEVIEENGRSREQQLASLRLADLTDTPTVLGLLVLGFDPSGFIPGAYLQFVRYDGTGQDAAIADEQELRHNVVDLSEMPCASIPTD